MQINGQCHCGQITYEAEIDAEAVSICHCRDCQTLTGSPFRVTAICSASDVKLTGGTPKVYGKRGDNGRMRLQHFCADCGSRCSRAARAIRPTIGASAGAASASATRCAPAARSGASRRRSGSTRCRCCRGGRGIRLACQAEARRKKPAFARWASARQPASLRERRLVGGHGFEPRTLSV